MSHNQPEKRYRIFVRAVNREPPDDEYAAIAACDALTEVESGGIVPA